MERKNQLVVVKVGSSSLTGAGGALEPARVQEIVAAVTALRRGGHRAIVVTSGAVAAGFRRLGYAERPGTLPAKQASAAVGQGLLIEEYTRCFLKEGLVAAQLLLTRADFTDKRRYHNAFSTLGVLLDKGAVPIINENDSVSIEELRFGDNDMLSAQVASLLHADLLVILTDIDGLYTADPRIDPSAQRLERVEMIDQAIENMAAGAGSAVGTGGMLSKIRAAKLATAAGVPVLVTAAGGGNTLVRALLGTANGTFFEAESKALDTRRQWLAFHSDIRGQLIVDAGAAEAVGIRHTSLLPSGIISVEGKFRAGEVVTVVDPQGDPVGRGIAGYDSKTLAQIKGLSSGEISKITNQKAVAAIHRDNWLGADRIESGGNRYD